MEYSRPTSLRDECTHYCAGCGHGVAHRLICEVIDELGIRDRVLSVAPVGCAVYAYFYWDFDCCEAAHGRAPAVATGMRRCHPDKIVFTYQGDGDLAAIGAGEIVNAANRGERISVFFVNNAVYGMTGGQMAPTTLQGQKTTTTPAGRDKNAAGWPMKIVEMLAQLNGTAYAERCALDTPKNIRAARAAIRKAFDVQIAGLGFSIVEMLSICPTCWGMQPVQALEFLQKQMIPYYPLGVCKEPQ
ncbi:2-oxoglutarate oxidoreductase [bacterium]|nr:2-oxoglutarate oxidoreductase [bacterium]